MGRIKKIFHILIIIIFSLFLFKDLFQVYFFQDDFFVLYISRAKNLTDILSFFIPRSDVQFYRPLSHELFYFFSQKLFALNYVAYHLIAVITWIIVGILVYLLSMQFVQSKSSRLFILLLFTTSAIHYNSLYWIVNYSYILITFFYILAFLVHRSSINIKNKIVYLSILFILGLLTNEFMVTFPLIVIVDSLLSGKIKKNGNYIIILISILLLYLGLRFILFKPHFDTYKYVFDEGVISSYRWFFLFFLGWAETIEDYMISFYQIRENFILSFPHVWQTYVFQFFLYLSFSILIPVILIIRMKEVKSFLKNNARVLIFSTAWIVITLLPIIFVPSHLSPHQATIALVGFLFFCVTFLEYVLKKSKKIYLLSTIAIGSMWVSTTIQTIGLNNQVHWINLRGNLSRQWIKKAMHYYPILNKGENLLLNTDDKETIVALNDGRGIQTFYDDYSLHVFFKTSQNIPTNIKVVP